MTEGRIGPAVVATHGSAAASLGGSQPHYVGVLTRTAAFACDAVLVNLVALIVTAANALILSLLHLPKHITVVIAAIGGVVYVLWNVGYFVVFWSSTGQTPGGRVMQIRIVPADGGKLPPLRAGVRYFALLLAAIPLFAGFVPVLFDSRRRAFQDYVARTVVVEAPDVSAAERRGMPRTTDSIVSVGDRGVRPGSASPPSDLP